MKLNRLIWILGLVLAWGTFKTVNAFEGVVDYKYTFDNGGKEMTSESYIKGMKVRVDMESGGYQSSMIMDPKKHTVTTLLHKQKMYMTNSVKDLSGVKSKVMDGKFYKVSGSKTILGHNCEHWIYEGKSGKSDMWLATGLGSYVGMDTQNSGSKTIEGWIKAIKGRGMFPLEMQHTGKGGKTMTMEATKLEEKTISDSLFKVPEGYKKMPSFGDMGGAGKQPSGDDILKGMKPKLPF